MVEAISSKALLSVGLKSFLKLITAYELLARRKTIMMG